MDTLVNFRDLGGIVTLDNKKVVNHQFLRSGEIVQISAEDKKELVKIYSLKKIVDFRGDTEVSQSPDDTISGVSYEHIDILGQTANQGAGLEELLNPKYNPQQAMMTIYEELVLSKDAQKGYSKFLSDFLTKPNEATLFHCFAGKDRTGFAAALILSSLNVSKEAIDEDYLKTNDSRKAANDAILNELKEKGASTKQLANMLVMLTVNKDYLDYAFELINQHFGSVENYFTDILKLPTTFSKDMQTLYTI